MNNFSIQCLNCSKKNTNIENNMEKILEKYENKRVTKKELDNIIQGNSPQEDFWLFKKFVLKQLKKDLKKSIIVLCNDCDCEEVIE